MDLTPNTVGEGLVSHILRVRSDVVVGDSSIRQNHELRHGQVHVAASHLRGDDLLATSELGSETP